jgi:pimeloyl-ACP methyl ester carboxylesterase
MKGKALGAVTIAAAIGGPRVALRRWAANPDPTGGAALDLPEGREVAVPASDGGELAAWVMGPDGAPPVLCAHGWTADRRIWATVARRLLAAGRQVVVYDERGHGASTAGSDGLTIEVLGDDVASVIAHLDLRDVVVAGHSMGGMAVQAFAIAHPDVLAERVRGLALVATAGAEMKLRAFEEQSAELVGSDIASRMMARPRLAPFLVRSTFGARPALHAMRATAESFALTPPVTRRTFLDAISAMNLHPLLGAVKAPTVVLSGTWDTLVPHGRSKRTGAQIPAARFVAVPRAGHQLPFETPDVVADHLLAVGR